MMLNLWDWVVVTAILAMVVIAFVGWRMDK